MSSLFYVWLLLKYRPWQTFQLALGIAVLLIIAVAAISWHQYRTIELNKHKSLFTLQLLLQDGTTHAQAQAIASGPTCTGTISHCKCYNCLGFYMAGTVPIPLWDHTL
jgi:hypothetical protein